MASRGQRSRAPTVRGMSDSVETIHKKVMEKLAIAKKNSGVEWLGALNEIEANYRLATVVTMVDYYSDSGSETVHTINYHRVITSGDFLMRIDNVINQVMRSASLGEQKNLEYALNISCDPYLEICEYDLCSCGEQMRIAPETSELLCSCGNSKPIEGMIFKNEPHDMERMKVKHNGYEPSRHYRFWMERIQAIERADFPVDDLARMEELIDRDVPDRYWGLNIIIIRGILKELRLTKYNEHAALLVVRFGGREPPKLDFAEDRRMSNKFHKIMSLYDIVVTTKGNKPYYPYFIYKIIEYEFRMDADKRRLLNYIHLQSRETVIKNDKNYEKICNLMNGEMKYIATDPAVKL